MNIKDMKISTRLMAVMGSLTALLLAVVVLAISQMQAMRNDTTAITTNWLPSVGLVGELKAGLADLRAWESQHVLNTDEGAMDRIEKLASQAVATVEATRQEYGKLVNEPDEKTLFDALETDWKAYQALHVQLIDMSTKREKFPARKLLEGDAKTLFDKIIVTTKKISEYNRSGATFASSKTEKSFNTARASMVTALLLGAI
ncbi:MAG: hypothetical protein EBR49_07585, partial [Betaproteobacteria bacterium]|nr:hypothetical protein [Betaproteobacteria bacterium]